MDEIEQLIQELVHPPARLHPARIDLIQKSVQQIQRSSQGWSIGLALLQKEQSHFRFYGALTLMIKIRTDWTAAVENVEIPRMVLQNLIALDVSFTNGSEQAYVIQKVTSTLAAISIRSFDLVDLPVRKLMLALVAAHVALDDDIENIQQIWDRCGQANARQIRSLFWLGSALVEEVTRSDLTQDERIQASQQLSNSGVDIWYLITMILRDVRTRFGSPRAQINVNSSTYMSNASELEVVELGKLALEVAATWMTFCSSNNSGVESESRHLKIALQLIFESFQTPELADAAISCLTTISQQAARYIAKAEAFSLASLINSAQAETYFSQLLKGEFEPEPVRFVTFLVGLLEFHNLSSPSAFADDGLALIVNALRRLLYTPGIAVIEDEVCQTVLDAFNQIADQWGDWTGNTQADQIMKPLIREVCVQSIGKSRYPDDESVTPVELWESDDRVRFQDYRNDVEDLLLASFACMGSEVIDCIVEGLDSSVSLTWQNLETRLYCLGAFSPMICKRKEELGRYAHGILSLGQWQSLLKNPALVPELARKGAIRFISRNTFILQDDQRYLLSCINFLFDSLHLSGSTTAASRAISALCHSQRSLLVDALTNFIESVSTLTKIPSEDRNRIIGGIGAIVQALPTERMKVDPLSRLFTIIQAFEAETTREGESASSTAINLLCTLVAVGKGLRAPSDAPIDVESQQDLSQKHFWTDGEGSQLQRDIQNITSHILTSFPEDSALIEAGCDILRCGYTELHPSPYKFRSSYSVSFLTSHVKAESPRVGYVIDTASAFLASQDSQLDDAGADVIQVSSAIVQNQRELLNSFALTNAHQDHEFTYSSLQYFARMLPRHSQFFKDVQYSANWETLFEFSLVGLELADTLPRRSAAQFWASIFEFADSVDAPASQNLAQCVDYFGPRLVSLLLSLLGGGAARSELEMLSDPLRKLVACQGVRAARFLRHEASTDQRQGSTAKRFVEQILALRGGRKTVTLVKDFWLGSRGSAFAYAK